MLHITIDDELARQHGCDVFQTDDCNRIELWRTSDGMLCVKAVRMTEEERDQFMEGCIAP